jgi:ketosteroid isomerase-like protein
MRALAVVVAVAACGGGGGGGATKPKAAKQSAVDEKQAEKDAKGLVTEIYETIGRGNKDSLFSLLDDSLVVFGPRKLDAPGNRAETLVALGGIVDPKKKLALRSGSLEVVASAGGRSAWAFDVVNIAGEPHAVMAILINTDDLWQLDAAMVAQMPAAIAMKAEAAKDSIVPPGAAAKTKIDPDAKGAVERFQKGLLDQEAWGADLTSRSDALVVGPTFGEVARGKQDVKKLWKQRTEAKTRAAVSGEIVAATTPDGQIAWVSAPVTRVAEGGSPMPLRVFAVFEKSSEDWKLIALQESLAIDAPGAGAPFRKIMPPPPKEEKPVVVAKEEPKPDKAKKKNEKPKKKKAKQADPVVEEEVEKPRKKKKKEAVVEEEDEPKAKKKKKKEVVEAEEDDEKPKKKKKKKEPVVEAEEDDEKPKKKKKKPPVEDEPSDVVVVDDADEKPKKKKKQKPVDDE